MKGMLCCAGKFRGYFYIHLSQPPLNASATLLEIALFPPPPPLPQPPFSGLIAETHVCQIE